MCEMNAYFAMYVLGLLMKAYITPSINQIHTSWNNIIIEGPLLGAIYYCDINNIYLYIKNRNSLKIYSFF